MPYLSIHIEGQPKFHHSLERAAIIGRSRDADVSIHDHRLSRQHCRFEKNASGEWIVTDLASTNGTIVGGERISTHALSDGESIQCGRTRIVFHARSAPPTRPAQPARSSPPEDSRGAAPSPGDTIMDTKFRLPKVDPTSATERKTRSTDDRKERRTPLAFQRPPARPLVPAAPGARSKGGFLRSVWNTLKSSLQRTIFRR